MIQSEYIEDGLVEKEQADFNEFCKLIVPTNKEENFLFHYASLRYLWKIWRDHKKDYLKSYMRGYKVPSWFFYEVAKQSCSITTDHVQSIVMGHPVYRISITYKDLMLIERPNKQGIISCYQLRIKDIREVIDGSMNIESTTSYRIIFEVLNESQDRLRYELNRAISKLSKKEQRLYIPGECFLNEKYDSVDVITVFDRKTGDFSDINLQLVNKGKGNTEISHLILNTTLVMDGFVTAEIRRALRDYFVSMTLIERK